MNPQTTIKRHFRRPKMQRPLRQLRVRPMVTAICLTFLALFAFVSLLPGVALQLVGLPVPQIPAMGKGIEIYDREDRKVCTIYGARDQQPVRLDQVSPNLQHAIIAAEDHDFYNHDGINLVSILRAILVDISARHPLQGGSTISQQLVKNLYFEGKKRNIFDKMAEAAMALAMEQKYSKEDILEGYLNCVYFGGGAYGIENAAEQYFGEHASQLNVAQSAFLAGLVTAPSELSQPRNHDRAVTRQVLVLNSMKELGYITQGQFAKAKHERIALRRQTPPSRRYKYYTSEILAQLKQEFGEDQVYAHGYKVYTHLDPAAQRLAESALANGIRRAPHGINQGALVSISVKDGGIIAMVGGAGSYERNQWNRALSPHTAGSAFKPFVYLTGLAHGILHPDTMLDDAPLEIKQAGGPTYRPRNFDGSYLGPITIRKALALSRNTCAVRVAQECGPSRIVDTAHDAGITAQLDANLSLALGSSAVSPLEMANAYATLARGGTFVDAAMVRRIEDADGNVLKSFSQNERRVFDQEPVAELVDALQDVVERGTGTGARLFDRPVAGKTGTSDAAKDIWFIGFTPDTVTAVWGGNDQNKPVAGHVTGGSVMAGIWQNYMRAYYRERPSPPGAFMAPMNPLMEEPEPLHILPAPADIFDRIFGPIVGPRQGPVVREYHWRTQDRPEVAPDNDYEDRVQRYSEPPTRHPPRKKRGVIRRFLDFLDL